MMEDDREYAKQGAKKAWDHKKRLRRDKKSKNYKNVDEADSEDEKEVEENSEKSEDLSSVLLFDKQEAYLRGYIPLQTLKDNFSKEDTKITSINFNGNGYCTNAVLKVLSTLPKNVFKELSVINLTGCDAVTDHAVIWLEKILKCSSKLKPSVILDACDYITERTLFGIQKSCDVNISMRATGVTYSAYQLNTAGCPNFSQCTGVMKGYFNSHILILPERSITTSMSHLFHSSHTIDRKDFMQVKNWNFMLMNLTLTEMSTDSILYKTIRPEQPLQTVIPVSLQSDIQKAKQHVIDTITDILINEKPNPAHTLVKVQDTNGIDNLVHDRFITTLRTVKMEVSDDGILSSTSNSESLFMSEQTLTRSYSHFAVECIGFKDQKTNMFFCLGVYSGSLCDHRDTASGQTYAVGVSESFHFVPGTVYGFGIEGQWESEYVPKKDCVFYKTVNGEKKLLAGEKLPSDISELYPVVSAFGKQTSSLKLLNYAIRPTASVKLQHGQRWLEPFYCSSLCFTDEGIISNISDIARFPGYLLLEPGISSENASCTIKILSLGYNGSSYIGVATEDYTPDNRTYTCFINSDDPKYQWNIQDEITISVSSLSVKDNTVFCKVLFVINGEKVFDYSYQFNATDGARCMFCLGLSSQDRVQIQNFRQKYRIPPLISSHVTYGRCYELELMDDGTLQKGEDWKTGGTSQFISKTPLSSSMPSFELELVNLDTKMIAIGLCSSKMRTAVIPGKMLDSLGYIVDSGKVHAKNNKGVKPTGNTKFTMNKLGYFTCGVEIGKVKVKEDGSIRSGQNVPVYFCFNGQKFYNFEFEHWGDGLYPIVALAGKDEVKLKNFSVEDRTLVDKVVHFSKVASDGGDLCDGSQFTVVGVNESDDSAFTIDELKQQINLRVDLPISSIEKEISKMERNLNGLNFHGQFCYSLCNSVLERMNKLCNTPNRLQYLSFDLKKKTGGPEIIEHLASNIRTEMNTHPFCYELPDSIVQLLDIIEKKVQEEKIMKVSELFHVLKKTFPKFYKIGWYHVQAIRLLHEQGKLTYIPELSQPVVVDTEYFVNLSDRLSMTPKHVAKDLASSVHPSTEVWFLKEIMNALVDDVSNTKNDILMSIKFVKEVLEKNLEFLYVPCLRTNEKDELFAIIKHSAIKEAPVELDTFRSTSLNSKNYKIMTKTYSFIHKPHSIIFPKVFSKCMGFGRLIVCAPNGLVMQNGAVQSCIVQDKQSIVLESKCYSPQDYEAELAQEDIEIYVWNVFCVYTDLIELVLKGSKVLYTIECQAPDGLPNKSIGCYHTWKEYSFKLPETVCTLCYNCTADGEFCPWNGIIPNTHRECCCKTTKSGCRDCGICKNCARELWRIRSHLRPCMLSLTGHQDILPLENIGVNLETYNGLELISLTSNNVPVYLKTINEKKSVQIHPFSAGRSKFCEGDRLFFKIKDKKDQLSVQVFKNKGFISGTSCDQYKDNTSRIQQLWHSLSVPDKFAGKYVLKAKRFPTLNYTNELQRGMTMVCKVKHDKDYVYPRCKFVRKKQINNTEHYVMEYSVPDKTDPDYVTVTAPAAELMDFTWNDFRVVWDYKLGTNIKRKKVTIISAPDYLLSGGSKDALQSSRNWMLNTLYKCSRCLHITRHVTVQEQRTVAASRGLINWYGQLKYIGAEDHTFTYLPADMTLDTLMFPNLQDVFENTAVHKLCFLINQIVHLYDSEKFDFRVRMPLHLVDQPGIKPQKDLSTEEKYGNILAAWVQTALITNKTILPSYKQLLCGDIGKKLSRKQIEVLLHNLLSITTSFCQILAEHTGGTAHLIPLPNGNKKIKEAIEHRKDLANVKQYTQDPNLLIQTGLNAVCKAHHLCIDCSVEDFFESESDISYKFFHPYEETITALHWSDVDLKSISSKFYKKFPNLEFIQMAFVENLKSLPKGISKLKYLKSIKMEETPLETLPDDLMMSESLENITFSYCNVRSLPTKWSPSLNLTHLNLPNMLLTELPEEIGNLTQLTKLDLSGNLLEKLPISFADLQNLSKLDLSGFPWLTQGRVGDAFLNRTKFHDWIESVSIKNYLEKEELDRMFTQFDKRKNGELDRHELADLNAYLFYKIPRIGTQSYKTNAPKSHGFPLEICKLQKLTELNMRFQGISFVPTQIGKLKALKMLNVKNCPLLEALPGSLGHLDKLRTLQVRHCPSLKTPPLEVISRGTASIKAYLKRLSEGYTECRRTKLMLVGLGGVGKTSLIKALLSKNKKVDRHVEEVITDGIDIRPWTIKIDDTLDVTFSTWDFAGQSLYYNTHQFFLSKRAVYLLLWSCRQGYEHAGLDFWLSSISCHAPDTPIFVIGTHYDECKADLPRTELKNRYPAIQGYHFVSSVKGTGIMELQDELIEVALQQSYMNERIPQVWLNLETAILGRRNAKENYISWNQMKEISLEVGIYEEDERKEAVQLLHNLGTLQYFDNDVLRHHIVINPQWIIDVMACVVSVKQSPIKAANGHFHHKDTEIVWNVYTSSLHEWLMQLTEEFDLTFPLPSQAVNLVPCLLPEEPPDELLWPPGSITEDVSEASIIYRFSYIPAGLFNRAQVRLFQFSDGKIIWKRGSLLQKNNHSALITQKSNGEMWVSVIGPRPFNVLFLIHEIFESLVDEAFSGVKEDFNRFLMPCPLCVSKDVQDPWMFPADLVRCAMKSKTPFLQCMKMWNFHTVVISQLMEMMPENSSDNFDANLQRSISALQDLNSSFSEDIVLLYSAQDIPDVGEKDDKIHPLQIKDYLEENGYSCWFVEDKKAVNIGEQTLAVKNCKVVVALMSDNFEKDADCKNMLIQAMDDFKKHYVIVQLDKTENWKTKDIGMRIGKQELLVMLRHQSRFASKITDLGAKLQKIKDSQGTKTAPVCFISYCWANSHAAVASGTRKQENALGWEDADPRKLKEYLESNGISCWMDKDQLGRKGMYDEISSGIRNAKVFVACVSDQYEHSDNCMMEFRFGYVELGRPTIVAVVGKGNKWRESEIKFLLQKTETTELSFQEENPGQLELLLKAVKKAIPQNSDKRQKEEELKRQTKLVAESVKLSNTLCYQEEFELIQRKFMRHVVSYISKQDSVNFPRLLVLDFASSSELNEICRTSSTPIACNQTPAPTVDGIFSKSRTMEIKTIFTKHLRDTDSLKSENWKKETIVVKILCENEAGWHVCDSSMKLGNASMLEEWLRKSCPLLSRIYAILKQSSISLSCLTGKKAEQFQEWIKQTMSELQHDAEAGKIERIDFMESYICLRNFIIENYSTTEFIKQLDKCHLPTGKIYWLCETHQKGERITKLSLETGSSYNKLEILEPSDNLLKEALARYIANQNPLPRSLSRRTSSKLSGVEKIIEQTSSSDAEEDIKSKTKTSSAADDKNTQNSSKQDIVSLTDAKQVENVSADDKPEIINQNIEDTSKNERSASQTTDKTIPLRRFKAAGHVASTAIAATKFVAAKKNERSKACVLQ